MSEHHPILLAFRKASENGRVPMVGPLAESLKAEILDMDAASGTASLAFEPSDRFLQGGGVIHGGIVSTMLDYALAMAGFSRLPPGKSFGTVSLTVHFLKPVMPGRQIVKARIDRLGSTMLFASAELAREGHEQPLATATAVMAISIWKGRDQ